ncbi:dihydroorotate reductase [Niveomyces insectorum RCEF 264]|uniref:Dihydroorotate reductase n=1 Tax=Niveomyces insectorum RCEF 264 TaxID=1081102 RepID=A0A167YP96_9HYPO|nr:dihydroorotate reductase [Niveomyces insectorum RCEF 264]
MTAGLVARAFWRPPSLRRLHQHRSLYYYHQLAPSSSSPPPSSSPSPSPSPLFPFVPQTCAHRPKPPLRVPRPPHSSSSPRRAHSAQPEARRADADADGAVAGLPFNAPATRPAHRQANAPADPPAFVPADALPHAPEQHIPANAPTSPSADREPAGTTAAAGPEVVPEVVPKLLSGAAPEAVPQVTASPPSKSLPAPGPRTSDPIPVVNTVTPLPLWQRLGPLTWAADSYGRAQRRRPYVTQLCAALVIALLADLSVQRMNRERAGYDPLRTLRSLVIGAVAAIPGYNWFVFLAQHFNYSSRVLSLVTKVTVNQIVYTPIFNSYFFGMQALLAGETLQESWDRVRRTVPISFVNSLKLWPAVTAFSFTFVPLEYRSVFAGVVAVGWQTYLMYLNRLAEDEEAAKAAAGAVSVAPAAVAPVPTPVPGSAGAKPTLASLPKPRGTA